MRTEWGIARMTEELAMVSRMMEFMGAEVRNTSSHDVMYPRTKRR